MQRNCGLRKEVTAAGIKVTRRAGVARRKRDFVRNIRPKTLLSKKSRRGEHRKINAGKAQNAKMA
jgi:hypothetical protein